MARGSPLRGIPRDEEFTRNLSMSVGLLVVGFGIFEFSLNVTIAVVYHMVGKPKGCRDQIPLELKRRLRFLKDAAKQFPALAPFKGDIGRCTSIAKRLAHTRDGVIHGYPADYDDRTHTLTFLRISPEKPHNTIHKEDRLVITAQKLLEDGTAANDLGTEMGNLSQRILKAVMP